MNLFSEMPSDPAQFETYADFYIGRAKDLQKQYENQSTMGDVPEIPHFIALGNRFIELTQNGTSGDLARARQFFCAVSSHPHNYPDGKRWSETGLAIINTLKPTLPDDDAFKHDEAIMHLCWAQTHQEDNPDQALISYHHVLSLAVGLKNTYWQALAYMSIGNIYYQQKNYAEAKKQHQQALDINQGTHQLLEARCLYTIGKIWDAEKQYKQALEYYKKASLIYQKLENTLDHARLYFEIGMAWKHLGRKDLAIDNFREAIKKYPQSPPNAELGNMAFVLGVALADGNTIKQRKEAVLYLEQAQTIYSAVENTTAEQVILITASATWGHLGNHQKAIDLAQQALIICREKQDKRSERIVLACLGHNYLHLKKPGKAIDYYEQELAILRELKGDDEDKNRLASALIHVGAGWKAMENWHRALAHYKEASLILAELNDQGELSACYAAISDIYEKIGKPDAATEYAKKVYRVSHSPLKREPISLLFFPERFIERQFKRFIAWLNKRQK